MPQAPKRQAPKNSAASPGEVMPPAFPWIPVLVLFFLFFFLVVFSVVVLDFGCLKHG
jgi:hypothetical protein